MNNAELQKVIDDRTGHWAKTLGKVREEMVATLEDGAPVRASDFEAILRTQIHDKLWRSVRTRQENGMTPLEALTSLRAFVEEKIREEGLMNSTSIMSNAEGVLRREAMIRWSDVIGDLVNG
jgi:hypothetical protein